MHLKTLTEKIKNKTAIVGIIGLGYVGLPLTLRFIKMGFKVVGFDIDDSKVKLLSAGKTYIQHIPADKIADAVKNGFTPTTDFSKAKDCDALIICVPTPLDKHREPDLSYVTDTMDALVPHLRPAQIVSLESTTYPGTTDEELQPRIEKRGFKIGQDIFLVHSPEREDPGNPNFTTETIPKVCGGITPACLEAGIALYSQVINKVVPLSSTRAAELTKLLENIHRVVNIGLVNEMKIVADKMDIDIHEVIRAAATKPFGFTAYYPGPGIGGHCIPVDPFYLTWKAREYGVHTKFIELAGEINTDMPNWVIRKLVDALNENGKSIRDAKVLLLGVAYKKNVDDIRESPSMELLEILLHKKAKVDYSDPFFPKLPRMRKHNIDMSSVALTAESLASYDCILLATNHDAFDYELIKKHGKLIIDTRGVYRERAGNIVKA